MMVTLHLWCPRLHSGGSVLATPACFMYMQCHTTTSNGEIISHIASLTASFPSIIPLEKPRWVKNNPQARRFTAAVPAGPCTAPRENTLTTQRWGVSEQRGSKPNKPRPAARVKINTTARDRCTAARRPLAGEMHRFKTEERVFD